MRSSTTGRLGLLALLLALFPYLAHAEVMDKEPALASIWFLCGAGAFVAFLFAIKRTTLLGIIAISGIITFFAGLLFELHDANIGPAILREAGIAYVVSAYAAPLMLSACLIAAVYFRRTAPN
jgi:hypothetical protein